MLASTVLSESEPGPAACVRAAPSPPCTSRCLHARVGAPPGVRESVERLCPGCIDCKRAPDGERVKLRCIDALSG